MANRITQEELNSYLWGAAVLLRSHIDAGSYKQYIFPLMFFKRLSDVYDEESTKAIETFGDEEAASWDENHKFKIPAGAHWADVRNTTQDVGASIVNAFRAIESANIEKLSGIFGEGAWTNKRRLPDRLLKDLLEHFSSKVLSIENCPEDEFGQGYEYLIKQFADDSGHTAQEFYTNRTVVHLMTELLKPQSGESVYDPTCGSAGMLISCIAYLKSKGEEWRNVSLYGQEFNQLSSAMARMNLFLHGIEDFDIACDDTLKNPVFTEGDRLRTFDIVLANPPYSIKQWDRNAFASDKYGRNLLGVPPQGRADYAFIQHMIKSLDPESGRCAILLPHGVLFRAEEAGMRTKMIQMDLVETVIGLGANLFFNSPMEACILICRAMKPASRKGRIQFIDASAQVTRRNAQSCLEDSHIESIARAYFADEPVESLSTFATTGEVLANDGSLNIPLYVRAAENIVVSNELLASDESARAWVADSYAARAQRASVRSFLSDRGIDE